MTAETPIARGTVSTDGRYWWDGHAWVPFVVREPLPEEAVTAPPVSGASGVGRGALVVFLVAVMLGVSMIVVALLA